MMPIPAKGNPIKKDQRNNSSLILSIATIVSQAAYANNRNIMK